MNRIFLIFSASIIGLFFSCQNGNDKNPQSTTADTSVSGKTTEVNSSGDIQASSASQGSNDRYIYTGTLGTDIKIVASLRIVGDQINGSYKYKRQKDTIALKGTVTNGKVSLQESDSKGQVTGTFTGEIALADYTTITGEWSNGKKTYPFQLKRWMPDYKGSAVIENKSIKLCECAEAEIPVVKSDVIPFYVLNKINPVQFEDATGKGSEEGYCDCNEDGMASGTVAGNYEVAYNQNGLLCILYSSETMGAYPSSYLEYLNYHLGSGNKLGVKDVFKADALSEVDKFLGDKLKAYLEQAIEDAKKDPEALGGDELREMGENHLNSRKEGMYFSFYVKNNSIILTESWGFPHFAMAAEPSNEVTLTQEQVNRWVNPESPLSFLIKK